jgi:hypothetical protein
MCGILSLRDVLEVRFSERQSLTGKLTTTLELTRQHVRQPQSTGVPAGNLNYYWYLKLVAVLRLLRESWSSDILTLDAQQALMCRISDGPIHPSQPAAMFSSDQDMRLSPAELTVGATLSRDDAA